MLRNTQADALPQNSGLKEIFVRRVTLLSSSSGSRGGGEHYLVLLAAGLQRLGCDVTVLMADHPRMDALEGQFAPAVSVQRIPYRSSYDRATRSLGAAVAPAVPRQVAQWIAATRPDLVHLNKQNLEDGLDLVRGLRQWGGPCVATVHVTRSMFQLGAVGGRLRDVVARHVLRRRRLPVVTVSAACARQYTAFLGGSPAPVVQPILNGIAEPERGDRAALRRSWGIRDGEVVLGCTARLEPQKNPLWLVREVLPQLPDNVRLVWIGDGSLRHELESAAAEAGVQHQLVLDGWRVDAAARLAGVDVFVLPSRYEGFPFSILEAMAMGLPCVVSDVDGCRESVNDGDTGRLCPIDDAAVWISALSELTTDEEARRRLGGAARKRYEAEFTVETMARRTLDFYGDVVARHRRGGG